MSLQMSWKAMFWLQQLVDKVKVHLKPRNTDVFVNHGVLTVLMAVVAVRPDSLTCTELLSWLLPRHTLLQVTSDSLCN